MCYTNAFLRVLYLRCVWSSESVWNNTQIFLSTELTEFYFHKLILKTIIRNNCIHQYLTGRYEITVHWDMMPCHVVYGSQTWHETAYPPNRLSPFIKLHGVRSQNAVIVLLTTVITANPIQNDKIFSMMCMWNSLRMYLHWSIQIYVFCQSYDVREINMWNKISLSDFVVNRIYFCHTFRITIYYARFLETSVQYTEGWVV